MNIDTSNTIGNSTTTTPRSTIGQNDSLSANKEGVLEETSSLIELPLTSKGHIRISSRGII